MFSCSKSMRSRRASPTMCKCCCRTIGNEMRIMLKVYVLLGYHRSGGRTNTAEAASSVAIADIDACLPEIQSRRHGREPLEPICASKTTTQHRPRISFPRNRLSVLVPLTLLSHGLLIAGHRGRADCAAWISQSPKKHAFEPGARRYPEIVYERRSTFRPGCLAACSCFNSLSQILVLNRVERSKGKDGRPISSRNSCVHFHTLNT
ncbi:hypothetical protein BU25DRAFT_161718 [Macroventuria anomochaeta]|uniref:Uncharacterized protein n=1 Tax=Macroventuria anomochaeta TaxID=301207 RepID=A0ACB6RSK5_9PLEO|nr:uncharacterized protein BU25DRAFT_161718 [Macroventuria anomochaeta]KAF2624113.1 hypothetical protein BU25DRAFT_161718 [Macroventuria anomochaeta]